MTQIRGAVQHLPFPRSRAKGGWNVVIRPDQYGARLFINDTSAGDFFMAITSWSSGFGHPTASVGVFYLRGRK